MSIGQEKKRESYEEDITGVSVNRLQVGERQAAERRLVRKLDSRLLPTIVLIFLMNYIDVRCVACGTTCHASY